MVNEFINECLKLDEQTYSDFRKETISTSKCRKFFDNLFRIIDELRAKNGRTDVVTG